MSRVSVLISKMGIMPPLRTVGLVKRDRGNCHPHSAGPGEAVSPIISPITGGNHRKVTLESEILFVKCA